MRARGVAIGVAVALSAPTKFDLGKGSFGLNSQGNLYPSLHYKRARSGRYVGAGRLDWLRERLSERDWAVLRDVAKLRLVTGAQLERLHFAELGEASCPVVRRRVLGRLVKWQVLATLGRRIGGVRAGSAGLVYGLNIAGKRLLAEDVRATRPSLPGERYVRHVLAVAEVYVDFVERARLAELQLDRFDAEPASWWPDGRGGRLKPDAYVKVASEEHQDSWWVEVDLATEHLPTVGRKLMAYVEFYNRGQLGPGNIMPWVLVTVPDAKRYSDFVRLIRQLPHRDDELFTVALHNDAAEVIMRRLGQL